MLSIGQIESYNQAYQSRARFLVVYLREAHPDAGPNYAAGDPSNYDQRRTAARRLARDKRLSMPVLVDHADDRTKRAYQIEYGGFVYVDPSGRIRYRSQGLPYPGQASPINALLREHAGIVRGKSA